MLPIRSVSFFNFWHKRNDSVIASISGQLVESVLDIMAAKFKAQKFVGGSLEVAILYLLLGCEKDGLMLNAQPATDDAGKLYLNRKESDVRKIAGNATSGDGNCGEFQLGFQPGM